MKSIAGLKVHPLANLFPLLEGDDFVSFCADIEKRGLRTPIDLYQGLLLDGRNRARACKKLGIKPKTRVYKGKDPLGHVISLNMARRHLNESQRAMVAAQIATLEPGRPAKDKKAEDSALSQRAAATSLNVDRRSVQHARKVLDGGTPELRAAVESGHVAVSAAAKVVGLSKREQNKVAKTGREGGNAAYAVQSALRGEREKELSANNRALPKGKYTVILADPPWKYSDARPNIAPDNHYPPMELSEICALPVADLAAKNCVLFLWVTAPFALDAEKVLDAWGFQYKSQMIWEKEGKQPTGHWCLVRHELIYIAVRGNPPPPRVAARFPSTFGARVRKHSEKPEVSYERFEAMYPKAKRIELFSRNEREGWKLWGNEVADAAE